MNKKKDRLQFYIALETNRQLDIVSEKLGVKKGSMFIH